MSFEYHGWIRLVADDRDDVGHRELVERERELAGSAQEAVLEFQERVPNLTLLSDRFSGSAGIIHLHGVLKHGPGRGVKDLFEWAAKNLQDSYGLLLYRDGEASDGDRYFVVRLAQGRCTIHRDTLLSPVFEVIEPPPR